MSEWSAAQYSKFKRERTIPAFDLANSIKYENPNSVLDIGCGTGLRPYLEQLSADDQKAYSNDVMQCLRDTYPIQKNGEIIFRFPRLFFLAKK